MKKLYFFLLLLCAQSSFGQHYNIDFDNITTAPWYTYVKIDTVNYHRNIWQVGLPQKTVFRSDFLGRNAIVTDTIRTYLPGDTSVFYLKLPKLGHPAYSELHFYSKMNYDTSSRAIIEFSGDLGAHWGNLITEDTIYDLVWVFPKPIMDLCDSNWHEFRVDISRWMMDGDSSIRYPQYMSSDTFEMKFTFVAGRDTSVYKDGWMLDYFNMYVGSFESVTTPLRTSNLNLFPNPAKNEVFVSKEFINEHFAIYDLAGRKIASGRVDDNARIPVEIEAGNYILEIYNGKNLPVRKTLVVN